MAITTLRGTPEGLALQGAGIIAERVSSLLAEQPEVTFAVPGGRSVSGIFAALLGVEISWKRVHIFIVDERLVPLDDPESNYLLAKGSFLDRLVERGDLPEGNVHPFVMDNTQPDRGTAAYEEELKGHHGRYDIILLSAGEDGHVGGLYPRHHSVMSEEPFFLTMHDSPKPPPDRMSSSRMLLSRADTALLIFLGEAKREALRRFSDPHYTVESCPATLVRRVEHAYVLTDLEEADGSER